jgi:retron-type reverse transcriptase
MRGVQTDDRHLAVRNISLLQRQAGVDPDVAELVVAWTKLRVDAGATLEFELDRFAEDSIEARLLVRLSAEGADTDGRFLAFLAAYGAQMERRGFAPIYHVVDLARQLSTELPRLRAVVARRARLYRHLQIPKRSGGERLLYSPRQPLRGIQRWIQREILSRYHPHDAAHGFVRGRSIRTNAEPHVGKRVVLRLDFADFFPSIEYRRVRKGFQSLGYPYSVAALLANLCTLDGRLPQGAITSPAISNLACATLDLRLAGLADAIGASYTRYADDVVFSSDDIHLSSAVATVRGIAADEGFRLREAKTCVTRRGRRQTVTGLVVNERVNVPREELRRLRAAAHKLRTLGPQAYRLAVGAEDGRDPVRVLEGKIGFVSMVDPVRGRALRAGLAPTSDDDPERS